MVFVGISPSKSGKIIDATYFWLGIIHWKHIFQNVNQELMLILVDVFWDNIQVIILNTYDILISNTNLI